MTTNNRMELMAAIAALEALKRPSLVDLHTDSQYLRGGITGWIHGWKRNGWRTADRKPVKNVDLWQRLDALTETHEIRWHWVKGHAGTEANERADALAREGMAPFKKKKKKRKPASAAKPPEQAGDGAGLDLLQHRRGAGRRDALAALRLEVQRLHDAVLDQRREALAALAEARSRSCRPQVRGRGCSSPRRRRRNRSCRRRRAPRPTPS